MNFEAGLYYQELLFLSKSEAIDRGDLELSFKLNIEVSNSGPKIADEVSSKLFEPFFTSKSPGKGTGLGLSLSKGIIKNHDGELRLENSRPNTCFIVTLSRAQLNAEMNAKAG